MRDLSKLIDKFDNKKIEGITDSEQMQIFNAMKDLEMYQKVGTIAEFMELKDKQIPKKPVCDNLYACPTCHTIMLRRILESKEKYCKECGQRLDWGEE